MGKIHNTQYLDVLWIDWYYDLFICRDNYLIFNFHTGPGHSWLSRFDASSRETQYLPVCCADSHRYLSHSKHFFKNLNSSKIPISVFFRSYLVQVFIGYHTQKLESLCCKLLCWRCRRITALQNMEVSTITQYMLWNHLNEETGKRWMFLSFRLLSSFQTNLELMQSIWQWSAWCLA